jgi:hypothetical protein
VTDATKRDRAATPILQDAPIKRDRGASDMQAGDEQTGLWNLMRQRWLDVGAQPQEPHLHDDTGLPALATGSRYVPILVQAWRR